MIIEIVNKLYDLIDAHDKSIAKRESIDNQFDRLSTRTRFASEIRSTLAWKSKWAKAFSLLKKTPMLLRSTKRWMGSRHDRGPADSKRVTHRKLPICCAFHP